MLRAHFRVAHPEALEPGPVDEAILKVYDLPSALRSRVVGVLGLVASGFLLFTLLTSNPLLRVWPPPDDGPVLRGKPLASVSSANSGLAADLVTSLAVRAAGNSRQVWIGSPAGVSYYEYEP
ncbi:MAG: hypothetical protein HGA66_05470 [Holophaga sp.]|nr:hypothetical protein [Holophaga sp.]